MCEKPMKALQAIRDAVEMLKYKPSAVLWHLLDTAIVKSVAVLVRLDNIVATESNKSKDKTSTVYRPEPL